MQLARLFVPLALCGTVAAQVGRDEWIVTTINDFVGNTATGALWHVDAAMTTATRLANQTANMAGANCAAIDDNGFVYYGTTGASLGLSIPNLSSIFMVLVSGGAVLAETPLVTAPIDGGSICGITLRGDQVWFVSDSGNVGWIPKAGGAPTFVMNLTTQLQLNGNPQGIATNGREIFIGTAYPANAPDPYNVWYFDAENPAPTLLPVAFLNSNVFAMTQARDNKVICGRFGGQLWLTDHLTQSATQLNLGATAPQSNSGGVALNPWSNVLCNVPGYGSSARQAGFYDVATNSWPFSVFLDTSIPSGAAASCEQPFFLYGHGCVAPNNVEPRQNWTGMPMQGQAFTLSLRDAENGVALLFLGFSDTVGPLGPLPADLAPIGAPGCLEYVSPDFFVPHVITAGTASQQFTVPTNPALAGMRLHAQWAIFGTATTVTEGLHIRVR